MSCNTDVALRITHMPTGKMVEFKKIKINDYVDDFKIDWAKKVVAGQLDPLVQYMSTSREITLSFTLGPFTGDDERKKLALKKMTRLLQFQYPAVKLSGGSYTHAESPGVMVELANYIRNGADGPQHCYITSMKYDPVDGTDALTVPKVWNDNGDPTILPQKIQVTLSLGVLHADGTIPAWDAGNQTWLGGSYWGPYFLDDGRDDDDPETPNTEEGVATKEQAEEAADREVLKGQ